MTGIIKKFFVILFVFIVGIIAVELFFRLYLRVTEKSIPPVLKYEQLLEKAWFAPHPHLVYTFKPNHTFVNSTNGSRFTINEFGYRSTYEFDVKEKQKPDNVIRVATLGGSSTMSVNHDREAWPYLLGKKLQTGLPDIKIEMLNEGIMGYTSLDNLIDLETRLIDFDSDVYVFYLGYNDYAALAPDGEYSTDHAHFRRTIWESLSFSYVELLPSWVLKSKAVCAILYRLGVRDRRDLLNNTRTLQFLNYDEDSFKALMAGKEDPENVNKVKSNVVRNIKSMIGVIQEHNPNAKIILSSFICQDNPVFIRDLNNALALLAEEYNLNFIDLSKQYPEQSELLHDSVHFTPKGERFLADIFGQEIIDTIKN